jgi:hypothetical protein
MTAWLESTALATWARTSPSIWAYPMLLTLHTVGLGIVVGACATVDVRLLGFAPRIRVAALAPLFRFVWLAFALNAATGVVLFMADATTKSQQTVFYVKLILIACALAVTARIARAVRTAPDAPAPEGPIAPAHRVLAVVSLALWAGAIVAGRLMAYL